MTDKIDPRKIFFQVVEPDPDDLCIDLTNQNTLIYNFSSEGAAMGFVESEIEERGDGEFIILRCVPVRRIHQAPKPLTTVEEIESPTGQRSRRTRNVPPATSAPDGASGGSSNPAAATDSETTTGNGGEADTGQLSNARHDTTSPPDGELGAIPSDPMEMPSFLDKRAGARG